MVYSGSAFPLRKNPNLLCQMPNNCKHLCVTVCIKFEITVFDTKAEGIFLQIKQYESLDSPDVKRKLFQLSGHFVTIHPRPLSKFHFENPR